MHLLPSDRQTHLRDRLDRYASERQRKGTALQHEVRDDVLAQALEHVVQHVADGQHGRVHADPALAARVGVEQRALDREGRRLEHVVELELHADREVAVAHRRHHQVSVGEAERAGEAAHVHAGGHTHAVHRLEAGLAREHAVDVAGEDGGPARLLVEGGVVEELSAALRAERGEGGDVGGGGAEEAVDGDLLRDELVRQLGVEGRGGLEKVFLGVGAEHGRNFALFELGGAERRHGGLEEREEAAGVLEELGGEVEGGAGAGVDVARGGEGGGERAEEGVDGLAVVDEVEEERGRDGDEKVLDVRADQLPNRFALLEVSQRREREGYSDLVEVHGAVEGHEAHRDDRVVAHRDQIVQTRSDRFARGLQHARRHRLVRHVYLAISSRPLPSRNKYVGNIGGRTQYSRPASNSTCPLHSSGRS